MVEPHRERSPVGVSASHSARIDGVFMADVNVEAFVKTDGVIKNTLPGLLAVKYHADV